MPEIEIRSLGQAHDYVEKLRSDILFSDIDVGLCGAADCELAFALMLMEQAANRLKLAQLHQATALGA